MQRLRGYSNRSYACKRCDEYTQNLFINHNRFIIQFIINHFLFSNQSYILIKSKSNIFICIRLLFRYFDASVETITDLANMWPGYNHCCRRRLYLAILVFSVRGRTLGKWYSVSASTPLSRRYKFAFDCAHVRKWIRGVEHARARARRYLHA